MHEEGGHAPSSLADDVLDGARDRLAVHHDFVGCQVLVPEVSRNPTQKPADGESNDGREVVDSLRVISEECRPPEPSLRDPLSDDVVKHASDGKATFVESRVLRIRHPEDVVDC